MRKAIVAIVILLVLAVAAVYIFIPSRLIVSEYGAATCSFPAAKRYVFEKPNWSKWQTDASRRGDKTSAELSNMFFNQTNIILNISGSSYETTLILIPFSLDSTGIEWRDTIMGTYNPINRIKQYYRARELKKNMSALMSELVLFLSNKEKVYSIRITKEQVTDEPLLSSRIVMNQVPSEKDAYELIDKVRRYAASQGDPATGIAMKYASKIDSGRYQLMVAIPTTRLLKGNKDFQVKGLVGGNPICTEVRGGEWTIQNAWNNIQLFKDDYRLSSPAIPYEMHITDRAKEPDTSKWITRIVYPTRL